MSSIKPKRDVRGYAGEPDIQKRETAIKRLEDAGYTFGADEKVLMKERGFVRQKAARLLSAMKPKSPPKGPEKHEVGSPFNPDDPDRLSRFAASEVGSPPPRRGVLDFGSSPAKTPDSPPATPVAQIRGTPKKVPDPRALLKNPGFYGLRYGGPSNTKKAGKRKSKRGSRRRSKTLRRRNFRAPRSSS